MAKYYESKKQGYCPKCGKEIEFDDTFIDGNEVIYYFTCDCGLAGSEIYELNILLLLETTQHLTNSTMVGLLDFLTITNKKEGA